MARTAGFVGHVNDALERSVDERHLLERGKWSVWLRRRSCPATCDISMVVWWFDILSLIVVLSPFPWGAACVASNWASGVRYVCWGDWW